MYPLKWHKNLSEEKWFAYPGDKQILMIANELNRAKNLMGMKNMSAVNLCYERAFELTDLTSADPKWKGKIRELRRFREMLGQLYMMPDKDAGMNEMLYIGLLRLSAGAYRLLYPDKFKDEFK